MFLEEIITVKLIIPKIKKFTNIMKSFKGNIIIN